MTHPSVTIQLFHGYLDILPSFLPKQMALSCIIVIIKKEQAYLHSSTLHTNTYFVNALDIVETEQNTLLQVGPSNSDFVNIQTKVELMFNFGTESFHFQLGEMWPSLGN